MKEYKVIVYREPALSSILLGGARINPIKFTQFLNGHAENGWRVITVEKDMQRLMLLFKREAYAVILEKDVQQK